MNRVQSSLAPLSPFTWDAEDVLAGRPAAANAVLRDIAELDLRFDLVVEEFATPCRHPLARIHNKSPLRCENLSARQLQLLQYGVVIHTEEQLVLVAAPPCCGDSGACLAASYEHLFRRPLDWMSTVATHSVLPEYTFVVYRVSKFGDDGDSTGTPLAPPQALFRLVYRNVHIAGANSDVTAEAPYKLVAVLASSATYYQELQKVIQYRRDWYVNSTATRASAARHAATAMVTATSEPLSSAVVDRMMSGLLPESIASEVRRVSPLSKLCASLALVLERFSAVDGTTVDSPAPTSAHLGSEDGMFPDTASHNTLRRSTYARGSDPWSFQYTCEGTRLTKRIEVLERTKGMLQRWRDGVFDLTNVEVSATGASTTLASVTGVNSTHPPLAVAVRPVPCARLLLMPSHSHISTQVTDNEISSFVPHDEAGCESTSKTDSMAVEYTSPAAERLRRWVLQGLVAAEVHELHAVLLELDPVTVLAPCVELLDATDDLPDGTSDGAGTTSSVAAESKASQVRYKRALLLVCQVAMETVERFVRHSGLVWKVTVAVRELSSHNVGGPIPASASLTSWCADVLSLLRQVEARLEKGVTHNTLSFGGQDDAQNQVVFDEADEAALYETTATAADGQALIPVDIAAAGGSALQEASQRDGARIAGALTLHAHDATGPAAPLPEKIASMAQAAGVKVRDVELYQLFAHLCTVAHRRDFTLPASALVDLLMEEWLSTNATKRNRHTSFPKRILCPMDHCGVPLTRLRVRRFLQPFLDVMHLNPSSRVPAVAEPHGAAAEALNYAQFSMVMFTIAAM